MRVKNIIVTGSSGFLGSRVVKCAIEMGYSVIGIDIAPPKNIYKDSFVFWRLDVNEMPEKLEREIDFIVHTASSLPYGNSAAQFEANNIRAAELISRVTKANKTFLVEIGSSSVYGKPDQLPVTNRTPLNPLDNYAKSKMQAELIICDSLDEAQYCIVRPRTILGTGRSGIFSIFFALIAANLPLPLPNSGKQIIQFVHVDDLAALSIHLGRNRISGIWPAASPEPRTLIQYLKTISDEYRIPIRYIPINPTIFKSLGGLAFKLKLTKFTPWHFGAFPYDNYVDKSWVPLGFEYKLSSTEAFIETFLSNNQSRFKIPRIFRIGRKV